jgi:hypothetical protein
VTKRTGPAGAPAGPTVQLLYLEGCPHWNVAEQRLVLALRRLGREQRVHALRVTTLEEAEKLGFRGSPTILIGGEDPFPEQDLPVGLSCRLYCTQDGVGGVPSTEQLVEALRGRLLPQTEAEGEPPR